MIPTGRVFSEPGGDRWAKSETETSRRLADSLEAGERFEIQVAGERVYVPARAEFNVEHEREGDEEEIEFQLKWTNR